MPAINTSGNTFGIKMISRMIHLLSRRKAMMQMIRASNKIPVNKFDVRE
jgi:hypothetical protein